MCLVTGSSQGFGQDTIRPSTCFPSSNRTEIYVVPSSTTPCHPGGGSVIQDGDICWNVCNEGCDTCCLYDVVINNHDASAQIKRFEMCTNYDCGNSPTRRDCPDGKVDSLSDHFCEFCGVTLHPLAGGNYNWIEDPACTRLLGTPDSLCINNCLRAVRGGSPKADSGDILRMTIGLTGACDSAEKCLWVCVDFDDFTSECCLLLLPATCRGSMNGDCDPPQRMIQGGGGVGSSIPPSNVNDNAVGVVQVMTVHRHHASLASDSLFGRRWPQREWMMGGVTRLDHRLSWSTSRGRSSQAQGLATAR